MEKYSLIFKQSVAKDFRKIPNPDIERILRRIELLRENPRGDGCIKLTNQELYRVRQGNFRIIYQIRDHELVIVVIKIGHRRDEY